MNMIECRERLIPFLPPGRRGWVLHFPGSCFRHALRVATLAPYKMNVVETLGRFEGRIHLLNLQPTMGETRMTGRTGGACQLAVVLVARKTAQALVHSDWGAVIP